MTRGPISTSRPGASRHELSGTNRFFPPGTGAQSADKKCISACMADEITIEPTESIYSADGVTLFSHQVQEIIFIDIFLINKVWLREVDVVLA